MHTLIVGEAPGPRGADRSGVPFLGDRAGRLVYDALVQAGCCSFPCPFEECRSWTGKEFVEAGVFPTVTGVALFNAYARCPTDDGTRFRAPRRREVLARHNQRRLREHLAIAAVRGLWQVCALGTVAQRTLDPLLSAEFLLHALPHPSAQGLLQAAPDHGRGLALADLESAWVAQLVTILGGPRTARTAA
ncbi:MAG: hypothetical protein H3C62_01225 [Gemmatimonadaceae bacterium]|nr:hypothetical protein [Gemmatimonadaceae bacterium]